MGKGKLQKFADMATYPNVFEFPVSLIGHWKPGDESSFTPDICGNWRETYFHNNHPIVLELGCGRGEYTVGLARKHPDVNYIGVDIKGARMWTGATQALHEQLSNVAFLRTNIEIIHHFFAPGEVQQLWLTFSDPQMKNPRKRLTSTYFLERYRHFLAPDGVIHLKTDSRFLYTYTRLMAEHNRLPIVSQTEDLYHDEAAQQSLDPATLAIQTYYESMWLERGLPIRYMQLLLPHDTPLTEPDVDIPLDDYRSYHRSKRTPKETGK